MGIAEKILVVLVFVLIFCFWKIYQHNIEKTLFKHVSWCVSLDSSLYRCNLSLFDYIHNAQIDLNINSEYRLDLSSDSKEKEFVNEILQIYQSNLAQSFLAEQLTFSRKPSFLGHDEFFMLTLCNFLSKHECEIVFNNRKMYDVAEMTTYGTWDYPLFDATYTLTEYANIYHRLYLIVQLFCEGNDTIKKCGVFQKSSQIIDCLNTSRKKVSRY